MLGLGLNTVYTVSLVCVLPGGMSLECGLVQVRTTAPDVRLGHVVYRKLGVARTWYSAQEQCRSGGGHLASLGHSTHTADIIQGSMHLSDWWTGGNICPDSPGNLISQFNS